MTSLPTQLGDITPKSAAEKALAGRTLLMSGGSRGIGLAIANAAARQGANVALLAKTDKPDPRLPGTIHTAAAEIEAAGGKALAIVGDVRKEDDIAAAVQRTVERFGGIDVCVNNASALALDKTDSLSVKKLDLMLHIQIRGTFLLTKAALPHLRKGVNPHILSLSPPLNLSAHWLGLHPAYTVAKYGMTLLGLGWAEEFREDGIASNTLWPESIIATAAVSNLLGGDETMSKARTPEVMADAALAILTSDASVNTGNSYIDVDVLANAGVTDLSHYGGGPNMQYDIYVDR